MEVRMPGRQAKIITEQMLNRMLRHVKLSPTRHRDVAIILLSAKAGLRACEIAKLTWPMVINARGMVADTMTIENRIAKKKAGRRIPIHRDLRIALAALKTRAQSKEAVIASARGGHMRPNSIVNWFVMLFKTLEYQGCSSHSGRRTFITMTARNVARTGGSLRDIQMLAGHQSIETTQRYIEGDTDTQRKLVSMI
jgi:integrase